MSYKDRLFIKFTSGRFLITIILTIAFSYLAARGKLTQEFTNIYMILVTFYFSKDRISVSASPTTTVITQESESKTTPVDGAIEGGQ